MAMLDLLETIGEERYPGLLAAFKRGYMMKEPGRSPFRIQDKEMTEYAEKTGCFANGMPFQDMANDYDEMIAQEFGSALDVIGISTGGSMCYQSMARGQPSPDRLPGSAARSWRYAELFRETAEGIPGARLILYPGMGHPAAGKRFHQDVLDFFLRSDQNLL